MRDDMEGLPSNFKIEEHVVAAAQHIVKLLATHEDADDDLRKILADLNIKLSAMRVQGETKSYEFVKAKDRLRVAEEKIRSWLSNQAMDWDSEHIFAGYLKAVEEVQQLVRDTTSMSLKENSISKKIRHQAENVLHNAMERLEHELKDMLSHCLLTFEPKSSSPCQEDGGDKGSILSAEDESIMGSSCRASSSTVSEHYVADLVRPDLVPIIKSIANVMFASNHDQEFQELFIASQKEALERFFIDLGIRRFSMEEVIGMNWEQLEQKIKIWVRAIKVFFPVYVAGEKRLCDQIFREEEVMGPISSTLFANIVTPSMCTLLTFGQGVAIGHRRPEKLFSLLSMYEALSDLQEEMEDMFLDEQNSSIAREWQELATRLGFSAKTTFLEFGDAVLSDPSRNPFRAGGVHPMTNYVMNYINTLVVYTNTLSFLLQDRKLDTNQLVGERMWNNPDALTSSPLASHLRLIVDKLELNLERKSQLYRDISLRHFFLLNNVHYIVQKVSGSELQALLGDDWIRERKISYYQHAKKYERLSWRSVLNLLSEKGGPSSSDSERTLRDRLRSFSSAFEELYKRQTGWLVKDDQLKSELRISITQKLCHAYDGFTRRCAVHNLERYIKYETDDLMNLVSDLFEGSSKSLSSGHRR